jgi:ectoine hydroxylase-related dioxygenase (phytanoyl-CoA dioxygenase family)
MHQPANHHENIAKNGFTVLADIYTADEIDAILKNISRADQSNPTFRKTEDLFAIRQFLKEVPDVKPLVLNKKLKECIASLFGNSYFIVKSIYFDKPPQSNWFVAWHQDLTISVDKKIDLPGYGPWTTKLNQFAVQPPVDILKDNFTVRIHLDDTDEGNGALKVISGSHLDITRAEHLNLQAGESVTCNVPTGGIMIMRPLLMHASNRSTTNKQRRVVHIEFSKTELPEGIDWAEKELV